METIVNKTLEPIEDMLNRMNANTVFGAPTTEGGNTIIPAAHIAYGFGIGFGSEEDEVEDGEVEDAKGASGGGGGGGAWATPIGYIHIGPEGVSYRSTPNKTLLGLAGILTGVWAIFWVAATIMAVAKSITRCCSDA